MTPEQDRYLTMWHFLVPTKWNHYDQLPASKGFFLDHGLEHGHLIRSKQELDSLFEQLTAWTSVNMIGLNKALDDANELGIGKWNGNDCRYDVYLLTYVPARDQNLDWQNAFVGTKRQVLKVFYAGTFFFIDNQDGTGIRKLYNGGMWHEPHREIKFSDTELLVRQKLADLIIYPDQQQWKEKYSETEKAIDLYMSLVHPQEWAEHKRLHNAFFEKRKEIYGV